MSKLRIGLTVLWILILVCSFTIPLLYTNEVHAADPVTFADPNLEQAVRDAIGKPIGDINQSDLTVLINLNGSSRNIQNLNGIEYCTNLIGLGLSRNQISNMSALSSLVNLQELGLWYNQITDISALAGLSNLQILGIRYNQINDISVLSGLTNLQYLGLDGNQISDISAISGLTNLVGLALAENDISDISPLSGITDLSGITLNDNLISDISALSGLINISEISLSNNQITDIQPLVDNSGISYGDSVYLEDNPLNSTSINTYIPQLQARGVTVYYDAPSPTPTPTPDTMDALTLISPPDGATGVGVLISNNSVNVPLSWQAKSGSTLYEWQVSEISAFTDPKSGNTSETTATVLDLRSNTNYYWRARVVEPTLGQWSTAHQFTTVISSDSGVPQLLTPEVGSTITDTTPLFTWSMVASTTNYEIQVAIDPGFGAAELVIDEELGDVFAYEADNDLANGTYYWRIKGINAATDTETPWSATGTFTLTPTPTPSDQAIPIQGKLAFTSDRGGTMQIYVMQGDNSRITAIGKTESDSTTAPALSPDGNRIAFAMSPTNSVREIYVVDVDGLRREVLTNAITIGGSQCPRWSPDGTQIVFLMRDQESSNLWWEIYTMNADGSDQRKISGDWNGSDYAYDWPSWSPDGSKIAYMFSPNVSIPDNFARGCEIYVMGADGSNQVSITNNNVQDSVPVWSPDGTKIAFASNTSSGNDGNDEIYVMNADGSNQVRLTDNPANDWYPAWSPDGTKIAFVSDRDGSSQIYIMNANGSNQVRITDGNANYWMPSWSSDIYIPYYTALERSVPTFSQLSPEPEDIGINAAFALIMVLVFYFAATIFNSTIRDNYDAIRGWFRFKKKSPDRKKYRSRSAVSEFLIILVTVLVTAVLYSFLDPYFAHDQSLCVMLIAFIVAIGVVTALYEGLQIVLLKYALKVPTTFRIRPIALVIAVIFVAISWFMDFHPGLMLGFVGAYLAISVRGKFTRRQRATPSLVSASFLLVVSLAAFLAYTPVSDAFANSTGFGASLAKLIILSIFLIGLEGLIFALLPLVFLDGHKIARWSKICWGILFGIAAFAFFHIVINHEGLSNAIENENLWLMGGIIAFFFIASVLFWLFFWIYRKRRKKA